jgi:hypothetical protein
VQVLGRRGQARWRESGWVHNNVFVSRILVDDISGRHGLVVRFRLGEVVHAALQVAGGRWAERAKCTLPPAKWEEKFDREKVKYWESVLKWQAKAAGEHKTGAPPPPKPTLIPKKESRRTEISLEHLSDDDDTPLRAHAMMILLVAPHAVACLDIIK